MATPPTSATALDMDNPETDARQAFAGLTQAEQEEHERAETTIPVNVSVDDAAVLKEAETAAPGPIGEASLAARVHEAATKERDQPAVMDVTPEEAECIQEAESRVVHAKESAEAAGTASATPGARVFP